MTQRTWLQNHPTLTSVHPVDALRRARHAAVRLHPGRAPAELVADELALIAQRRLADPPPPGAARPEIRLVTAQDRPAIVEMVARCSAETLRRRFHGPLGDASADRVAALLQWGGRGADHLLATVDGAVIGLGSLHVGRHGDGEIAVLVEDAWQGAGIGRRLTGRLLRRGSERGMATVVADVMREPSFVLEHLHRAIAASSVAFDGPTATVRIPLASTACVAGSPRPATPA